MVNKKTSKKDQETKQMPVSPIKGGVAQLKLGESYVSLVVGALVVVVLAVVLFVLLRDNDAIRDLNLREDRSQEATEQVGQETYTVQEGEGLWQIAEKIYGNGEYWVDIAEANNLSSPDLIETGMELKLPEVQKKNNGSAE